MRVFGGCFGWRNCWCFVLMPWRGFVVFVWRGDFNFGDLGWLVGFIGCVFVLCIASLCFWVCYLGLVVGLLVMSLFFDCFVLMVDTVDFGLMLDLLCSFRVLWGLFFVVLVFLRLAVCYLGCFVVLGVLGVVVVAIDVSLGLGLL